MPLQEKIKDKLINKGLTYGQKLANPPPGDEVVISGLAGNFPNSKNVQEFQSNLYNGVDMVSDDDRRWSLNHPEIPKRSGMLYDIKKFDPGYFGIHHRQAHSTDPMLRMFLEKAVEAIMDAGINPSELEGTNTGVFVGSCYSESQIYWFLESCDRPQYFPMTGNQKSMIPNRISYYLKLKGPSYATDTACSSSLFALEHAYRAIRDGTCDRAIVGGTNLCMHPFVSLQFARLGVLSLDGSCKVFDVDGNGYARAESIGAIFLQKSKEAKRMYGRIIHAKTNCDGYKEQGITFPSSSAQKQLFEDFYQECNIDPSTLSYMEAHGTGTKVGDPEEIEAIDSIFCKERTTPLLIGSVKSNIGHAEPASGLCSIAKVIIGVENNLIPPNIYFTRPREGLKGFEEGRLKVVSKTTPFEDNRGLIGINSFGFGGGNCHVLFEWNHKHNNNKNQTPSDELPRLVCVSGRVDNSITSILDDIKQRPLNVEYISLFHNLFRQHIKNHLYRGYSIISKSGELSRNQNCFTGCKRSLYIIFSDFGDSWPTIAKHLSVVPLFATTLENIFKLLTSNGISLESLFSKKKELSLVNKILGNMAVQIGIAELLKILKLEIDGFCGSGISELVCGYFEDTLTLEETVFSTYQIAKVLEGVDAYLQGDNFVSQIKPQLQKLLHEIILEPKPRGCKWLSSTTTSLASAEHFVNSLNIQLPFRNFCDNLKRNSTIFELGNGGTKFESKNIKYVRLENNENKNSFLSFLELLGSLYNCGHNPQISELYPKVQYPVTRGTPMIAPLIKWDHRKDWYIVNYTNEQTLKDGENVIRFSVKEDMWRWLSGHMIDGRNLLPATGYLYFVWEVMSLVVGIMTSDMDVVFENCKFLRATQLTTTHDLTELNVSIQRGSGNFEVSEGGIAVCTGRIYISNKLSSERVSLPVIDDDESIIMNTKDIYKELRLRGYHYKGMFKRIKECNVAATKALIQWDANWVSFMDNMLQMKILQSDTRSLYVPTGIERLSVEAKKHIAYAQQFGEYPKLPVYNFIDTNLIKCGAIEICGLTAASIQRRKQKREPVLEKYEFVPNCGKLDLKEAIRVNVQLILENLPSIEVRVVEVIDQVIKEDSELLGPLIYEALGDLPLVTPQIMILSKQPLEIANITVENQTLQTQSDCTLVIGTNLLHRPTMMNQALGAVKSNGFVLSRESLTYEPKETPGLEIVTIYTTETEKLVLCTKHVQLEPPVVIDVTNTTAEFEWLPTLQKFYKNSKNIIIVAQNEPLSGILGLVNCIRREPGGGRVKCFFILGSVSAFDPCNSFYTDQLKKNLAINVYKNSQWGTYRHLLLEAQIEVKSEHSYVNVVQRGDLSSLRWLQGPLTSKALLNQEQELIHVYYAALNFRDIMTSTGRINPDAVTDDRILQECVQGLEFSGRTSQGNRVFGMITAGACSTMVAGDKQLIWNLPDHFTLEEGATIPVVYGTVIQAFFCVTTIKKGDTVLIHAGSGGIGQAAITVAVYCGLTVYTTVGTKEKRDFLQKRFPQLKDCQIGNSRDTSFETMIFQQTKGRGVDIVLNSLAEENLEASVRCLARGGKFLEIGKFDLVNNRNLQLLFIEKEASFHGVMLDHLFPNVEGKNKLQKLVQEAIECGMIQPLARTVYRDDEIERAFRFMAGGKHMGKVLIEIRKEETEKIIPPAFRLVKGLPRYNCNPDDVYVITGGLGGFGLELADWLVLRGARKIILSSRKGLTTGYQYYRIRIWRSYGAIVTISTDDITLKEGCEKLLEAAKSLGNVQAIFNLAVVLKDSIFENQTASNFNESLKPKAFATKNLDEISRRLCPNLRDFVIFSSVSCGRGNAGQTNYGMANSIMERICEKRKEDGFPALAIQWGAVGDVGLVADMQELDTEIEIGGTLSQSITSCLQVMDKFLNQKNVIVSSIVVAEKRRGGVGAENIIDTVACIIGIRDIRTISLHSTLAELGMDSMSAVEIKQTLEREFEVFLTAKDMRSMTFAKLQEIQEEKLSKQESENGNVKKERSIGGFEMVLRLMNDEIAAQLPIIQMKSRSEDLKTLPQVIFFPGLEGASKVFDPLVANLFVDAKCIQYPYDRQDETIKDMANYLLTIVEPLLIKFQPFNIVAYSFGSIVALEIVSLLNAKGYTGNLICIDGAPQMLKTLLSGYLNVGSIAQFETGFICQLLSVISSSEINSKFTKRILDCETLQERLAVCEEILPKNQSYSVQFFRKWSTSTLNRLKALNRYYPNYKIKSKVTLFKPQQVSVTNLPEDYSLSKYCENFGKVRVFEGNHVTILENVALAEAINKVILTGSVTET